MRVTRSGAAMLTLIIAVAVGTLPAAAETSCKSWFLGICTGRYTTEEQARIDAD